MQRLAKLFHTHAVLYIFAFTMVATIVFLGFRFMTTSSAASFQAGNIMSDYVMSNYNSMTKDQIQAWLTAKNPCNNHDYNLYVQQSNAYNSKGYYWHWTGPANSSGHFVCISEERFDGTNIGSGKTAAEIIYQAAQDYKINPQVLLVLLQKEQGLITDTLPNSIQYRKATGYGCPDTAACDSKYYGLENQIRKAASLFRTVLDGGWSNYPAYSTVYIQYHPNSNCGGTNVYIQNRATSALYRYTPYQPNSAALSGSGNTCSSYGNRNFFNYFTNWFGDTQTSIAVESNTYLPEGNYTFLSGIDNTQVIDISGASTDEGGNVQLWSGETSSAQTYNLTYDSNTKLYTITNLNSGKVLDVSNAGTSNGTNIQQWNSNNTCAQKWAIINIGNDQYKLLSACSGKALDVSAGIAKSGQNIQLWDDNGTAAQRWVIRSNDKATVSDATYTIYNKSGYVLDVSNGSRDNGGNVQIWSHNTGINTQKYNVNRNQDGTYKITNINSGKVIDLSNSNTSNNTNVQIWGYNSSVCAQKWILKKQSDGTISILSACSNGKAIDVDSGVFKDGQNVQLWDENNTTAQKWVFEETQPVISDNTYRIVSSIDTSKNWDVDSGLKTSGAKVQLWDKINSSNGQKFKVYLGDDGYYKITNINSGLAIDISDASTVSGAQVQQWGSNNTCAQKYEIYRSGANVYTITNKCSGKAIDLSNGTASNGRKIQLWDNNNTAAQKWHFESV